MTEDESARLKGVAVRLLEIQAACENEPEERRREILREGIARSVAEIPAEERKRYLQILLTRFANEDNASDEPCVPEEATSTAEERDRPSSPAPRGHQTAEECLSEFLKLTTGISEERRVDLAKKLAEAGFNWVDRDQMLVEVADGVREALGLPTGLQPRLTRMVQLNVGLIELVNRLDQLVLKTFSELSPRSPLAARRPEFREAVADYLTAKSDSVDPQMRAVSAMLGGLMAAMLGAGREFGRQYIERFSPSSIEDVVKGEGKVKLFGNEKALCWDKYKDLSRDYATLDLIDRRLRECLGTFAEKKASSAR